jgi:hypothetical protein
MLSNERYGGHVVLHGKRITTIKEATVTDDGEFVKAEPVLDKETFDGVQALMASRRRGRRASGRWPLTGTLFCGNPKCDGNRTLAGYTETRVRSDGTRARRYICAIANGGCGLAARADRVEEMVAEKVLAMMADPDLATAINAQAAAVTEARDAAQQEVADLDDQLADLEVKKAAGEIRELAYQRAKPVLERRIKKAEAKLEELGVEVATASALPAMSQEEWDAATPAKRRRVIADLHLRVTILPHPEGAPRNRFVDDRVLIEEL